MFWLSFCYKGTRNLLKFEWRQCIAAACPCLECLALYCLAPPLYSPSPSSLLLFLLLPTLLSLDPSCVCLQPSTPEPSATTRRRRCRHAVMIGLELHFLQLIARNGHEGVHVHLLSKSHHPSVTHTRVRMWMHAVVMYTQTAHVQGTCTLRVHLCLYVLI